MQNVSKHFFLAYSALKNKGCKTIFDWKYIWTTPFEKMQILGLS